MLIDEARDLGRQIKSLEASEIDASEAKRFSTRSEELKGPVKKIKTQLAICSAMRNKGVAVRVSIDPGLRSRLKILKEAFHEDHDSILDADGNMRWGFWDPLKNLPGKLNQTIQISWKAHVDSTISRFPEEFVDALAVGSEEWAGLKDIYGRIDELRDQLSTVEAIDELTSLTLEESEVKKNLGAYDELEELIPFVTHAKDGTATLEMVTEELKSLLEEKDLLHLFNIGLIEKSS